MTHDCLDDAARDRATAWALGSLTSEENTSYEAHLAGCALCRYEATALRDALGGLDALAPTVAAPQAIGARLMDRIRRTPQDEARPAPRTPAVQVWKQWDASGDSTSGFTLLRAGEGGWQPTGVEGVEVRKLFVDAANDRATMLVRMAPGSSYPSHGHSNVEECLVLEGDLTVGEHRMRTGDYQRASGGSRHGVQSTAEGCLLFIVSSLHDEILPGAGA